jgi:hypothetical protein
MRKVIWKKHLRSVPRIKLCWRNSIRSNKFLPYDV